MFCERASKQANKLVSVSAGELQKAAKRVEKGGKSFGLARAKSVCSFKARDKAAALSRARAQVERFARPHDGA